VKSFVYLAAQIVFWLAVIVALVTALPLAWIWSANTLFGLSIPFSFKTWVAALILGSGAFARATYTVKR
jgi:hypothetical protein